jgi:hypothetical protein
MGGKARAQKMTDEERRSSARRAAAARWGKKEPPRAIKEAPLTIGNIEFECAVLDDDSRVLSERAFSRAIGAKRGGSHWQRRKQNPDGANLPVFLSANNLRPFVTKELSAALSDPTIYQTEKGQYANGIKAELIPKILDVWLKARDEGQLTKPQERFAKLAEILMRGLAATGIVALIDEATGIQEVRASNYLAKFLEKYVQAEIRQYIPTFPTSFFRQLCRLNNVPFREDMKLPRYFGHFVNDLVYARLAPGVLAELQKHNAPQENGRRRRKNFQYLTRSLGEPKLLYHIGRLEGIAEDFPDGQYEAFREKVDQKFRKYVPLPLFAEQIDSEGNFISEKKDG